MIDVKRFHDLRLGSVFASDPTLDTHQGDFYEEYQGGSWDFDQVEGVEAFYGQKVPDRTGILTMASSGLAQASEVGPENKPVTGPFTDHAWLERANKAAAALGFPKLFGIDAKSLDLVIPGLKAGMPWGDGTRRFLSGAIGEFDIQGIVHDSEGLLRLEIRHRPTVQANRHG